MSGGGRKGRQRRPLRRYLPILAWLVVPGAVLVLILWPSSESSPRKGDGVVLAVPGRNEVLLTSEQARDLGAGQLSLPMPGRRAIITGSATITYKLDRTGTRRELASLAAGGGTVYVDEWPVQVDVDAPLVKQVFPNNCETAALQMLLATVGIEEPQRRLQKKLRRDGPLDPRIAPDGSKIWGNPEYGFVGRVEGGGTAGGFGVYEKPLMDLVGRWAEPVDLTGKTSVAIFQRLLGGHAVLAWIGLSAGPYEVWRGPRRERVKVNDGEHTVLLRGLAGSSVLVNDPLSGESQIWSRKEFKEKWNRLGRRAISLNG